MNIHIDSCQLLTNITKKYVLSSIREYEYVIEEYWQMSIINQKYENALFQQIKHSNFKRIATPLDSALHENI